MNGNPASNRSIRYNRLHENRALTTPAASALQKTLLGPAEAFG